MTSAHRTRIRFGSALIVALLVSGCVPQPTPASPAAQRAMTAQQIGTELHRFEKVVRDLMDAKSIAPPLALDIFQWLTPVYQALDRADAGWQVVAQSGWKDVRDRVAQVPALKPWIQTVNQLLGLH